MTIIIISAKFFGIVGTVVWLFSASVSKINGNICSILFSNS